MLLAIDASLPIQQMYQEYSARLNSKVTDVSPAAIKKNSGFGSKQRSGLTRRNRSREALIQAAMTLIMNGKGVRNEDVAAAAGVSQATLYNHFPAKEQLLDVAYQRLLESVLGSQ